MTRNQLFQILNQSFDFEPTQGQQTVMAHLSAFLLSEKENPTYLLKGYAGTGKTTLVTTLVKTLPQIGMKYVLLAPTGRAAKVLNGYTGKPASTIHRKIYRCTNQGDGNFRMKRVENKHKNTVFIVDEVSMIGDLRSENQFDTSNGLLVDLFDFVFLGENCRLLLIGDTAQLPPVGMEHSPALEMDNLKNLFSITVASFEMKEVMRQSLESGILFNATKLRNLLLTSENEFQLPLFSLTNYNDISQVDPDTFEDLLFGAFGDRDCANSVIVCRSNKRANLFNQSIRNRILGMEGEISTGDLLMVVKNNYYWLDNDNSSAFIANGDIIEVKKIVRFEEVYGFNFAEMEICLIDYPEQPKITVKVLLDTLHTESPALTETENRRLFTAVEADYMDIPSKRERYAKIKANPFFNALQIKFAYALTCHKTQGGQWNKVFVDSGIKPDSVIDRGYIRWLYTALTRASQKLFLVNFDKTFFDKPTTE